MSSVVKPSDATKSLASTDATAPGLMEVHTPTAAERCAQFDAVLSRYQTVQNQVYDNLKINPFLVSIGSYRRETRPEFKAFILSSLFDLYGFKLEDVWTYGSGIIELFFKLFDVVGPEKTISPQSLSSLETETMVNQIKNFLSEKFTQIDKSVLNLVGVVAALVCSLIGTPLFNRKKESYFSTFARFGGDLSKMSGFGKAGTMFTSVLEAFGVEILDISSQAEREDLKELTDVVAQLEDFQQVCIDNQASVFERLGDYMELDKICKELDKRYSNLISKESYKLLSNVYNNFKKLRTTLSKVLKEYMSSAERQVPVCLYLYGESGVGKSELLQEISRRVHKKLKLNNTTYSRSPSDKFWSGYRGQSVVIYDDMFSLSDGKDAQEFISAVTAAPYGIAMGDLADKGTHFSSKFLFCASNTSYYSSSNVVTNPRATDRRRHLMFEVALDAPYRRDKFDFSNVTLRRMDPIFSQNGKYLINGKNSRAKVPNENNSVYTLDEIVDSVCELYKEHKRMFDDKLARANKFRDCIEPQCILEINKSEGYIPVLIGPPGIGKTTIINTLAEEKKDTYEFIDEFTLSSNPDDMALAVVKSFEGSSKPLILATNKYS